jgi:hypothetical protein
MKDRLPDEAYKRISENLSVENSSMEEILIEDYSPYWKAGQYIHPLPNGDYIEIDKDKLLHKRVNYIDYVKSQNVKVTGVDLTRRDQFLFINFFHLIVLKNDLRIMQYFGDNYWEEFESISIKDVIIEIFDTFQRIPKYFEELVAHGESSIDLYDFSLIDFSKSVTNRPNKNNSCKDIITRLTRQGKQKYIPEIMQKVQYVVIFSENMENQRLYGRAYNGKMSNNFILVEELLEELRNEYPTEYFNNLALSIEYEEYINALAICRLNFKYYFERLVKSMTLYLLAEEYPNEIAQIDNGEINTKEGNEMISKMQDRIVKKYTKLYFPTARTELRELTKIIQSVDLDQKPNKELIFKMFPEMHREVTLDEKSLMMKEVITRKSRAEELQLKAEKIYRHKLTNRFTSFKCRDSDDAHFNSLNTNELLTEIQLIIKQIIDYKTILKSLR